jgi:hypothetical protein
MTVRQKIISWLCLLCETRGLYFDPQKPNMRESLRMGEGAFLKSNIFEVKTRSFSVGHLVKMYGAFVNLSNTGIFWAFCGLVKIPFVPGIIIMSGYNIKKAYIKIIYYNIIYLYY